MSQTTYPSRATALRAALMTLKRQRLPLVVASQIVAVAALALPQLLRDGAADDTAFWPKLMLAIGFSAALTYPILVAVLASIVIDVEHRASSWNLWAGLLFPPGRLARLKAVFALVALALVVVGHALVVLGCAATRGIDTSAQDVARLAVMMVNVWLVSACLMWVHLAVALVFRSQLGNIGLGIVGAFIGVYSLLTSSKVTYLLLWGYYSLGLGIRISPATAAYSPWPEHLLRVGVSAVVFAFGAVVFWWWTGRLAGIPATPAITTRRRQSASTVTHAGTTRAPRRRSLLAAEIIKLRRSAVTPIIGIIVVMTVVTGAVNYANNTEVLSPGWDSYISQVTLFYGLIFAGLCASTITAAVWRGEHTTNSWPMMATTPVTPARLLLAKAGVVWLAMAVVQVLLAVATYVGGVILGLGGAAPVSLVVSLVASLLATIPLILLQTVLSARIASFAIPIGIGFVGIVMGILLSLKGAAAATFWPYSQVTLAILMTSTATQLHFSAMAIVVGVVALSAVGIGLLAFGAGWLVRRVR
ncbi:ABC transporter permease [Corynebacterium uterequi]|uniref:ABC-2 family transporter protein n=1 Tax=Corynebacterium uterequi TaxID=1072256 RepID=A0A0G3HB14_9CORY|nr:ABC transporter permease [Corynebacterium uterequi]AKK10571.1 hypothetical protein CUTER_02785 [Corynebacterium uterequi]